MPALLHHHADHSDEKPHITAAISAGLHRPQADRCGGAGCRGEAMGGPLAAQHAICWLTAADSFRSEPIEREKQGGLEGAGDPAVARSPSDLDPSSEKSKAVWRALTIPRLLTVDLEQSSCRVASAL